MVSILLHSTRCNSEPQQAYSKIQTIQRGDELSTERKLLQTKPLKLMSCCEFSLIFFERILYYCDSLKWVVFLKLIQSVNLKSNYFYMHANLAMLREILPPFYTTHSSWTAGWNGKGNWCNSEAAAEVFTKSMCVYRDCSETIRIHVSRGFPQLTHLFRRPVAIPESIYPNWRNELQQRFMLILSNPQSLREISDPFFTSHTYSEHS